MLKRFLGRIGAFRYSVGGYALRHKLQAGATLLVLAGLGFWGVSAYHKSATTTQYVLAAAHMAPIEETVTGSGQVESQHQLNLAPKASGTLVSVSVKPGDTVGAGQVIASVDSTTAQKALRDAAASLESARISYLQSQTNNTDSVEKSRESVFTTSASVYSDLNAALTGIDAVMQGNEVSGSFAVKNVYAYSKLFGDNPTLVTYRDQLISDYASAKAAYDSAYQHYSATSHSADPASAAQIANETYAAAQSVSQAAKDLNDYLTNVQSRYGTGNGTAPPVLSTQLTSAQGYLTTSNSDVSSALTAKNDIASAIQQSGGSGAATLSEESAQLAYQKAQNSYQDAKDALADYAVIAPFPGVIASVPLQKYDSAGSGTTVAVLTTTQQIATLSLNEVDAAKVKAGQKATLTFDAIDGLSIDGTIAEVDTVGTVSQGVVSYTVKIGFDTQDARVLPGMTVDATIVTAAKDSALVVPSSAVKTTGSQAYVEIASYAPAGRSSTTEAMASSTRAMRFRMSSTTQNFGSSTRMFSGSAVAFAARAAGPTVDASNVTVRRVPVVTGITSDTMTEIMSGLTPGEFVVSQSLNASGKTTTQTPSLLNLFGARGGAAGATRAATGAAGARGFGTGAAAHAGGGNAVFVPKGG